MLAFMIKIHFSGKHLLSSLVLPKAELFPKILQNENNH